MSSVLPDSYIVDKATSTVPVSPKRGLIYLMALVFRLHWVVLSSH
jgi:hypothetical protein